MTVAMLEILTTFAVLAPFLLAFHDDELTFRVEVAPFNVPVSVEDSHYASDAIADELRLKMSDLILVSGSDHDTVLAGIIGESFVEYLAKEANIEDEIHSIKLLFGIENRHLLLSVTEKGGKLEWKASVIRMPGGPIHNFSREFDVEKYHDAIATVARWAMRHLDPLTVLKYEYAKGQQKGEFASAWAEIGEVTAFYGNRHAPEIENLAGMMHLYEGNVEAAKVAFSVAVRSVPDFDEAKLNLAVAKAATGDRAKALVMLDEAAAPRGFSFRMDRKALRAAALGLKGLVASSDGNSELAVVSVLNAVDVDPYLAEAHEMAAAVLRDQGYRILARHHEKEATSIRAHHSQRLPRAFLDMTELHQLLPPRQQPAKHERGTVPVYPVGDAAKVSMNLSPAVVE
jgi:Tfp pilus assembly protein PilF